MTPLSTIEFKKLASGQGVVYKLKRYADGMVRMFAELNLTVDGSSASAKAIYCNGAGAVPKLRVRTGEVVVASGSETPAFNTAYTVTNMALTNGGADVVFTVAESVAADDIDDASLTWEVPLFEFRGEPNVTTLFNLLADCLDVGEWFAPTDGT